jgi:uncharacterized Tic20 family protein
MSKFDFKDDQLVAGLCHASFLIPFIGAIVPFTVWLSQRERSSLLRFQALQALVYQLLAVAVYFLYYILQMVVGFGSLPAIFFMSESEEAWKIVLIFFIFAYLMLMFLQFVVFCIGGPLYMIMGFVGTWRVLQGRDFHYPLLGRLVERLLNRKQKAAPRLPTGGEA